ncbi:coiled-coil domain-containing protein SCD2-like isoform X3 [Asparagus officinalis]|uniref:coiled-coil domain-containing protein SCD2-like isoform X3 n=1 Tax=Asparagus officinalis TaxID=4686 RepID=UPI00098E5F9A|nr:coiled-coil domain-containing protein SCD2-like isoform X3 [Asparagus officinalis]
MPPIELSTPRRANRASSPAIGRYLSEQTSTVRATSTGRPAMVAKQPALIPSIKPSQKPVVASMRTDSPVVSRRDKRVSVDLGSLNMRETSSMRPSSACQDEVDEQRIENETTTEKLQLAEERAAEEEARTRQHERQVASHGDHISLHVRTSRKEGTRPKREPAPRAFARNSFAKREEPGPLKWESKVVRDDAASVGTLQESESEIKFLRTMVQKMMLNQEQKEEVVLKRCWLARYWKLCAHHGIYADVAERKQEYWSSLAPQPMEVVLSAGEKARDGHSSDKADEDDEKVSFDISDLAGEGNIENMLLVEKGLRELASLKVEEAVLLAMGQDRRANVKAGQSTSGATLSAEGPNTLEQFELSEEELEDVHFKQAWLTYFWRRAKNHGLEEDIADDRLQFWIEQTMHSPTSQDAVEA